MCDDFFCWEQQHQQQQPKSKKKKKSLSALVYTAKKKKRKVYELVTVVANASKIGARLSLSLFYRPSVYITAPAAKREKKKKKKNLFFLLLLLATDDVRVWEELFDVTPHSPSGDRWSGHWVFVARQLLAAKRRREIYNHHASPQCSAVLLLLHTSI